MRTQSQCYLRRRCVALSVPDVARVKSYVTLERNGFVFLWYHAEGIDPVWEPPEIEEIAGGQWKYCGRSEHHINAHIEVLHLLCYIVMAELFYCLFKFSIIGYGRPME